MLADDDDNNLKCAIAVAPVTKWELYGMHILKQYERLHVPPTYFEV